MGKHDRDDRERDRDDDSEGGAILLLDNAVKAIWRGEKPTPEQLAQCEKDRGNDKSAADWNAPNRGSQNIAPKARVGLEDYRWLGTWCRSLYDHGHIEEGAPSNSYVTMIELCKLVAQRGLMRMGYNEGAGICRLVYRSDQARKALVAMPTPRLRDRINEGGVWRDSTATRPVQRATVAWAGNRWTEKDRAIKQGYTSADAASESLAAELASTSEYGMTPEERETAMRAIKGGDVEAAREVASWLVGTINEPERGRVWRWRLRRFRKVVLPAGERIGGGTEMILFGPYPNPMKKVRTVTQVLADGTHLGMQPGRRFANSNATGYEVEIINGIIHARCDGPSADLPELTGELLWEVNIVGDSVEFRS